MLGRHKRRQVAATGKLPGGADVEFGRDSVNHGTQPDSSNEKGLSSVQSLLVFVSLCLLAFAFFDGYSIPDDAPPQGGGGGAQQQQSTQQAESPLSPSTSGPTIAETASIIGTISSVSDELGKMELVSEQLSKELKEAVDVNAKLRAEVSREREKAKAAAAATTTSEGKAPPSDATDLEGASEPVEPSSSSSISSSSSSSSSGAKKKPLEEIDVSSIPTYTGYTFWSSDFHISPIADLKDLFAEDNLNQNIIDKSLSGHCHIMNPKTCAKDLRVLTKQNGINLDTDKPGGCPNKLKREFYESYKKDEVMLGVDAFLCHHAAGLCELFMAFGKPMVVVVSTRYEIGRHKPVAWKEWNKNLIDIAANPRNVIAANNRYDAEYVKYFTGLKEVPVIPNFCSYTKVTYKPTKDQILIGPGRMSKEGEGLLRQLRDRAGGSGLVFKHIRELYPHFEYADLAAHPAIVLIPYQVSIMSLFEYYRMNIPLFVPSHKLLSEWQVKYKVMNELTWDLVFKRTKGQSSIGQAAGTSYKYDPNDQIHAEAIEYWVKWSDFYEWPHITTFDDFGDLLGKIKSVDLDEVSMNMAKQNELVKVDITGTWKKIFHRLFEGVEPAAKGGRVEYASSWDDGMLKHYSIKGGSCGLGDDVHQMDTSDVILHNNKDL